MAMTALHSYRLDVTIIISRLTHHGRVKNNFERPVPARFTSQAQQHRTELQLKGHKLSSTFCVTLRVKIL